MSTPSSPQTGAQLLVRRLRDHGVRHVFGYPGGPLTPIYDAIYCEPGVRHILARDERSAAFMADGYARATGKPGVCLAVCGPGVFNSSTPMAGCYSDSVPVLLISGQVPTTARGGARSGCYHENDQLAAYSHFTKFHASLSEPASIVELVDKAWKSMTSGRPGPAFLDAPVNIMAATVTPTPLPPLPRSETPLAPRSQDIEALAKLLQSWKKPLLMAGGGVISAGAEPLLAELAERLGAPVFHTFMGKCALPTVHPLNAGTPWKEGTSDASDMASRMSPLFAEADGMLAIGCRFTQVITGTWALRPPASLAQIDIDPEEIGRHYQVTLGIHADVREALRAVLDQLPVQRRPAWTELNATTEFPRLGGLDLLGVMRRVLTPDTIVCADVTSLAYRMLVYYPVSVPRTFLHPAAAISMGFGLPAALGVKAALPDRTVVAVMGDGCFQMTGMELATAVQEKLPVVVILINDSTLTLIKAIQQRRYGGRFLGVDLVNPDFSVFAKAYGVRAWQVETDAAFEKALREAIALEAPALLEVRLSGKRV